MRWVMLVVGLTVLGCGGQSRSTTPLATSGAGGAGGASAAGGATSGASGTIAGASGTTSETGGTAAFAGESTSGAGSGGSGDSGGIGVWTEAPEPGDSAECQAYKSNSDIPAACVLAQNACPPDLTSYLAQIEGSVGFEHFYARSGCGLTELELDGGYGGGVRVFGTDGQIVGYASYLDTTYGPCDQFQYQRGLHIATCPDARECVIAPDAAETGQLCRCACPNPPPDNGVAQVDAKCVDRPSRGWTCPETLLQWGELSDATSPNATLRTGCSGSIVEMQENEGVLACVYDADRKLVGLERHSAGPTGCAGVNGWQAGSTYSTCPSERTCRSGGSPSSTQLAICGKYPYL